MDNDTVDILLYCIYCILPVFCRMSCIYSWHKRSKMEPKRGQAGETKPKEISPPQRQFDDLLLVIFTGFTPWRS
jgi:hypothetical protein